MIISVINVYLLIFYFHFHFLFAKLKDKDSLLNIYICAYVHMDTTKKYRNV